MGAYSLTYLLLHPEGLAGLVGMVDAIKVVEQSFGEASSHPIMGAPRRRIQ